MLRTSPLLSYVMSIPSGTNSSGAGAPNNDAGHAETADERHARFEKMPCNTLTSSTPVPCA